MTEHTDTERLDFMLARNPEIDTGSEGHYLRIWLGSCSAEDAGYDTGSGHYIARGKTARECIDNAIDNQFTYIG